MVVGHDGAYDVAPSLEALSWKLWWWWSSALFRELPLLRLPSLNCIYIIPVASVVF
jgi:hypothetical protein